MAGHLPTPTANLIQNPRLSSATKEMLVGPAQKYRSCMTPDKRNHPLRCKQSKDIFTEKWN